MESSRVEPGQAQVFSLSSECSQKARIVVCGYFQKRCISSLRCHWLRVKLRLIRCRECCYLWPPTRAGRSRLGMCRRLSSMLDCMATGTRIWMDRNLYEATESYWETRFASGRKNLEVEKALYGLRASPLAWEVKRDNSLAQLQWAVEGYWYGLTPAKGNPHLWAVVRLDAENGLKPAKGQQSMNAGTLTRSIGIQTEGQDKPMELMGGLVCGWLTVGCRKCTWDPWLLSFPCFRPFSGQICLKQRKC